MLNAVKFKAQLGFTLIEIIVTIAVLAVAFTTLVVVFNPAVTQASSPIVDLRAAEIGQAYLEEILGKRFDENSINGSTQRCGDGTAAACSTSLQSDGEARPNFDDVDDFNGLTESPVNALGNAKTEYANYSVSITVSYDGASLGLANNDAKRIDVAVQRSNGSIFNFSAYKTNF